LRTKEHDLLERRLLDKRKRKLQLRGLQTMLLTPELDVQRMRAEPKLRAMMNARVVPATQRD
jgi:hypothetical protein